MKQFVQCSTCVCHLPKKDRYTLHSSQITLKLKVFVCLLLSPLLLLQSIWSNSSGPRSWSLAGRSTSARTAASCGARWAVIGGFWSRDRSAHLWLVLEQPDGPEEPRGGAAPGRAGGAPLPPLREGLHHQQPAQRAPQQIPQPPVESYNCDIGRFSEKAPSSSSPCCRQRLL